MSNSNAVKKEMPEKDIVDETRRRFDWIMERVKDGTFDSMAMAYSGGKDSSFMLEWALEAHDRHDMDKPIHLVHIDDEWVYPETEEHVMRYAGDDRTKLWWCCLPVAYVNGQSKTAAQVGEVPGFWIPWHPDRKDDWVRPMPDLSEYDDDNAELVTVDHPHMQSDKHDLEFVIGESVHKGAGDFLLHRELGYGLTIEMVGIRTNESMARYTALMARGSWKQDPREGEIKQPKEGFCRCTPVFDWHDEDLWKHYHEQDWPYNEAYDKQWKYGHPPLAMRTAQLYNEPATKSKSFLEVAEYWPDLYEESIGRISGSNLGLEHGDQFLTAHKREDQTWKERTTELLHEKYDDEEFREERRKRIRGTIKLHAKHSSEPIHNVETCDECGWSWKEIAKVIQKGDMRDRSGL